MLKRSTCAVALSLVLLAVGAISPARASLVETYSAAAGPGQVEDADVGSGGTTNLWSLSLSNPGDLGQNGDFIGDSSQNGFNQPSLAGAGISAWALYANSNQQATATADLSALPGPIRSLSIQFDNGGVNNAAQNGGVDGRVGVRFLSGSAVASEWSFTGGESNYRLNDAAADSSTSVGFTDGGFTLTLSLLGTTGDYDLTVVGSQNGSFLGRTLAGGATNLTGIEVYNLSAGNNSPANIFFDNLTVVSVPEASPVLVMSAVSTLGLIFRRRRGL